MPKGLKPTSSPIQISASVTEAVAGTLAIDQIDLTLNVLDNEVFVVTQINIDVDSPDSVPGLTTATDATVSTTRRTSVGSIADQNVLASANRQIVTNAGMTADGGIPFDREDPLFSALEMDYLGIIATNNAFLNLVGTNNGNVKQVRARIYGYRATADSSTYAALVQSELLSA
jgi:hypothetical protein